MQCILQAWGVMEYMWWDYVIRIQKRKLYPAKVTEKKDVIDTFSKKKGDN